MIPTAIPDINPVDNFVNAIPFTAWEQAVFVTLFCVFVIAILYLIFRIVKEVRPIIASSTDSLQKFIADRDKQWQTFITALQQSSNKEASARDEAFNNRNNRVVDALEAMTARLQSMEIKNSEHDARMVQAIDDMKVVRGLRPHRNREEPKQ